MSYRAWSQGKNKKAYGAYQGCKQCFWKVSCHKIIHFSTFTPYCKNTCICAIWKSGPWKSRGVTPNWLYHWSTAINDRLIQHLTHWVTVHLHFQCKKGDFKIKCNSKNWHNPSEENKQEKVHNMGSSSDMTPRHWQDLIWTLNNQILCDSQLFGTGSVISTQLFHAW